ncbi:GtrA family protein [uncultured Pseudokineococcus sp.]|uniref:GtrA family protein n=1 Tax=uncultured Pseudokineococcus sp. TaxID=1642928 RepID=UPI002614BDC6|nr:GtrA family protein [uncultured Pseudokineococcus sp.]
MPCDRTSTPPSAASSGAGSRERALVPRLVSAHGARLLRYAGGSGVATVCSAVAFALLYGPLGASTTTSTLLGWLAGAVPNYVINRTWVWRVEGRPSVRRELGPYVAVVLLTLALASGATALAEALLERAGATDAVRVLGVNVAFLGVYAVMALVRYAVLHQLFRRLPGARGPRSSPPPDQSRSPSQNPSHSPSHSPSEETR